MRKRELVLGGLIFTFAVLLLAAGEETIRAYDTRSITIRGGTTYSFDRVRIEPSTTVLVSEGTVVSWRNWARGTETRLIIQDEKKCQTADESPAGFELAEAKTCQVSHLIPQGKSANVRFLEKGTYNYEIEAVRGLKARGKIVVE